MNRSESIKELASALAKAQSELKNPGFDSNNPHFRSKYASLAAVRDAVIPVLSRHGLSVVQLPRFEDGRAGCETVLTHGSGEYISETLLIPCDKANAHGVGSCITYSRRFSLMAIAGVVGDEDDDGNAAVGKVASTSKPILSEPITPNTGAWDGVIPARMEFVSRLADEAQQHCEDKNVEGVYEVFYGNLDKQAIDNDEAAAIWASIGKYSGVRNKVKKLREERKQVETA